MRKNLIIQSDTKAGLIIDKATALSNKSRLIVYIQFCIPQIGMDGSINLFLDLVELDSVTTRVIFDCMIDCLHSYGMTHSFLSNNSISLTCDGAAVMIGNKMGVGALFRETFPSLVQVLIIDLNFQYVML